MEEVWCPTPSRRSARAHSHAANHTLRIRAYTHPPPPQIQRREQIPAGSEEEVEIRACTVVAVEQLREAIAAKFLGACGGRRRGLTLNQSRKETVAGQGELQLQKRVVVHHRMGGGGGGELGAGS